ncbi:hypothetical protein U879_01075 [Defluviimonas sp. 20V17]|uniref:K+-transporting ATPase, A chain n=1 Tax=Allgaiera indica TaxID=765699 RepID=A0AAN4USW3_9RHOB|nr:DUF2834 domain-containing protein [Allgaiera indica]KDB05553.1 hypothetical protein U879_01075 [Defluviimonas sp. 20V17]GHE03589.1 hypothetical protein GCM10008024_27550 [Allgaiera indica]SDX44571.1 Protein of unknown function [Allgaiera indica]
MSALRITYLALAIWGAVQPMRHLLAWFGAHGPNLPGLFAAWQANAATTGLMWDLAIAAVALTVWVLAETLVRQNWIALLAIPATLLIGLSCGLPLYLFLRSRPVT